MSFDMNPSNWSTGVDRNLFTFKAPVKGASCPSLCVNKH